LVRGGIPRDSGKPPTLWLASWQEIQPHPKLYVLGHASNFTLLRNALRLDRTAISIGSPASRWFETEPERTLTSARALRLNAQVGGWHLAQPADIAMYELYCQFVGFNRERVLPVTAKAHPAWEVFSFLECPDKQHDVKLAELLTLIVDPRWFTHPSRPNRISRLTQFFGSTPHYVRRYAQENRVTPAHQRAELVRWCWDMCRRDYFREIYQKYVRRLSPEMAAMRTNIRFLQLLHAVWSARLTSHQESFVPEYFFSGKEQLAVAFRAHAAKWAQEVSSV
jgi:hypothetical protein